MSKSLRLILGSCVVIVIGAIVKDFGVETTGVTLMAIGVVGVVLGPLAAELPE